MCSSTRAQTFRTPSIAEASISLLSFFFLLSFSNSCNILSVSKYTRPREIQCERHNFACLYFKFYGQMLHVYIEHTVTARSSFAYMVEAYGSCGQIGYLLLGNPVPCAKLFEVSLSSQNIFPIGRNSSYDRCTHFEYNFLFF